MVTQVNRRGLRDWLIQRMTSVLVGIYTLFILFYLLAHEPVSYDFFHHLFSHLAMKIGTAVVLLCVLWHAWIGLWTVFTDYVKNSWVRLILEVIVSLLLIAYVIWLFEIFWVVL